MTRSLPAGRSLLVVLAVVAGVLTVPAGTPAAHATAVELVVNGGFEQTPIEPSVPYDPETVGLVFYRADGNTSTESPGEINLGSHELPGWVVQAGSVETDAPSIWTPNEGHLSLDLNGHDPGTLTQPVATEAGRTYRLRFALAVHPGCGPSAGGSVRVSLGDDTVGEFASNPRGTSSAPGWRIVDQLVTAPTAPGTQALTFTSLVTPGSCGPLLDSVSLVPEDIPAALSGVSLTADPVSTPPGADAVPLDAIPYDRIPASALAAVAAVPLRSVPLRSVPLRSVPLRSVPLRSVPLSVSPASTVLLSQLPLSGLRWEQVLAGSALQGVPLTNVTLGQVLSLTPAPALLDGATANGEISLDQVDLSATPLRSVSAASLYLGGVPIDALPLAPSGGPTGNLPAWCAAVQTATGSSCAQLGIVASSTVLTVDLAGVPLRSVDLDQVPLRSVPTAAPLRSVPLRSVPLRSVPLRSVPLRSVDGLDVAATPALARILLSALPSTSPVLEIAYPGIDGFPPCATCVTLRQAVVPGGPAATKTLGELFATGALSPFTVGDLGEYADATVGDLADHLGPAAVLTLAQVLFSLLDPAQLPWETLPLGDLDLSRYDPDGALVRLVARFSVGGSAASTAVARVDLPPGYLYAGGVSGLTGDAAVPTQTGQTVTFTVPRPGEGTPTAYEVSFAVHPPLTLTGSAEISGDVSTLQVQLLGTTLTASDDAVVQVVDPEPSPPPATAPIVGPDTLVVGHVSQPGDVDYLRVPVPAAGTTVTFLLSHLPTDTDLVVYGPAGTPPLPNAAPLRSVPLRSVPLPDGGVDGTGGTAAVSTLQEDVPILTSLDVVGTSTRRGTAEEEVAVLSPGGAGYFTVQLTGYNGSASREPYLLRTRTDQPVSVSCPSRAYPAQVGSTVGLPAAVPALGAQTRSLLLVNRQQLQAQFGSTRAATVVDRLRAFALRADVAGAVLEVDGSTQVAGAYSAWNADPCDVDKANAVVGSVTSLVSQARAAAPSITSVTLVGDDGQLPMGRVPDLTLTANERGHAASSAGPAGQDNPVTAAQKRNMLLSDDPYGTSAPIAWLNRRLYLPDVAVGRLVETPEQIVGAVDQFTAAGGVVAPTSALTTGYDFLTDGAQAVNGALGQSLGTAATRGTLLGETWTRADLSARLLPTTGSAPQIASVNAHFDQSAALPAAGNTTGDESDLFAVADVAARPGTLVGRLLFSMGCHAGLSIPDSYGAARGTDWAQTFADQRALWVANTGYGLGDTATVALSEALMREFAARLDGSLTAGQALTFAKQAYFGSLGAYGVYDEKVLGEVVLYGLPMFRIGGPRWDTGPFTPPTQPAPPTVTPVAGGDATGLAVFDATVTPTFTRVDTPRGSFWSASGLTQTTSGQPIQPRSVVNVTPASAGVQAHGALITALQSSDVFGVDPVFARATLDLSANEGEQSYEGVAFPASLGTLTTFATPGGPASRLVLVPGQFASDPGATTGVQRLFTSVASRVYYSASASFTPPTFVRLGAARSAGSITFAAEATPAPGSTVRRVLVLFRNGTTWRSAELTSSNGTSWTSAAQTVAPGSVEWFAQAVDDKGNVAVSTDKGDLYGTPSTFDVTVSGPLGDNGWYTGPVSVTVEGPAARYTASVDGSVPEQVFGSFQVSADGEHTVVVSGSNGDRRTLTLKIDSTPPVVAVTSPPGGVFLVGGPSTNTVSCTDATSGVVGGCPSSIPVSTATPGAFSYPLATPVRDAAGNTTGQVGYWVRYTFTGFFSPVSMTGLNVVKAGSAVPIKFSLGSATGPVGDLSAVSQVTTARQTPCSSSVIGSDLTDDTVAASRTSLTYDAAAGQFVYVWKTLSTYVRTCRTLSVTLADGTVHTAVFSFK